MFEMPDLSPMIKTMITMKVDMDHDIINLQIDAKKAEATAKAETAQAVSEMNKSCASMLHDMAEENNFDPKGVRKSMEAAGYTKAEIEGAVRVKGKAMVKRMAARDPELKEYLESLERKHSTSAPKKEDWISPERWAQMSSKERGKIIAARKKKGKQGF